MSSLLSADDLNDFIRPSVACIKPVEDLRKPKKDITHFELEFENSNDTSNINEDIDVEIGMNGDVIQIDKKNLNNKKKLEQAQISLADCLACSGCITSSEEVLISQHSFKEFINFWNENNNSNDIHYVLNLSQQSRSSLANAFNTEIYIIDKVLSIIFTKYYGFEYIISVNIGRELSYLGLYDEINENKGKRNLLASICPGWVLYVEKTHPELIKNLSNVRSPQYITGRLVKDLLKKEFGYEYDKVYNLSIMPCFDKKLEASRHSDIVNCVITPKELVSMILEDERIDIDSIIMEVKNDINTIESYVKFIESVTPRGWFKGNLYGWINDNNNNGINISNRDESGGYAIKYLEYYIKMNNLSENEYEIKYQQGRNDDIYEIQLIRKIDNNIICRSGVINGFKNIQNLVRKLKEEGSSSNTNPTIRKGKGLLLNRRRGESSKINRNNNVKVDLTKCEFVEVMACPSGCINGGGQISAPNDIDAKQWLHQNRDKYHSIGNSTMNSPLEINNTNDNIMEWTETVNHTVVVVFGASGDLAKKKTFPALFGLYREGQLSTTTKIIGFARSSLTDDDLRSRIKPYLSYDKENNDHIKSLNDFLNICTYHKASYDEPQGFKDLESIINKLDKNNNITESHRIYYLALPPSVFTIVATNLKKYCHPENKGYARLIVEKPFGHDLESAKKLQEDLAPLWNEDELFRIDHYLGKEMVKNLIPVRFSNTFLGSSWNNKFIDSIQITFKEPFGTEGRGGYFDSIGIIRDVIQNHLLQVLTLLLMEKPKDFNSEHIRDEKVKLLKSIKPIDFNDVLIGQYSKSEDGSKPGYLDDETVKANSKAITYAAIVLHINNETWENVPIILKAGKALDQGKVEIRIQFKPVTSGIYENSARNELVIRVQPDEAMYLKMNIKVPGVANKVSISDLDLTYKDRYSSEFYIPQAYESLIKDCFEDDHSNFVRDDELEVSWALFTPLLNYLESENGPQPIPYPYGSRGPKGLSEFMKEHGYVFEPKEKYQWPVTTPESSSSTSSTTELDSSATMTTGTSLDLIEPLKEKEFFIKEESNIEVESEIKQITSNEDLNNNDDNDDNDDDGDDDDDDDDDNNNKWIDCGTGYCSGKLEPNPHFYVINESDSNDILLNAPIKGSTQYQRQQDTLIVWTNEEGIDYALSFQETDGCLELCEFLIEIQKDKLAPNITLVAIIQSAEGEITEIIAGPIPQLPIPTQDNLNSILDLLAINQFKNKIINQILENNGKWIIQLIEIFKICENNHQLSIIYCLSDIIKMLVYFNEMDIFEILINEEILYSIIGILEYEPEYPGLKLNWRIFFNNKFKIKEVIKLNNVEIENQIRKCFILKFLKDAVLARLLDDSGFNCISTMIQNKECKILEFIETDDHFLKDLFAMYNDNDDDNNENIIYDKKLDGIKLINQYVLISKSQQPYQRTEFYKTLIDKGLMSMIKFSTIEKEIESRILITEVIVTIIEHEILLFKNSNEEILMSTLINILINEKNIGLKTQAFEAIKILIDPNNLIDSSGINTTNNSMMMMNENSMDDIIDDSFFIEFYEKSATKLFQPIIYIIENDEFNKIEYKREDLITLENLCELLGFVSKFHDAIHSRSFILENHLLKGINKLIDPKFKYQLRLSAVRCLRNIILLNDEYYTRYIIENDVLNGFANILDESNDCNNLVNSTCLNFLNIIINNIEFTNFQLLKKYLVSNYASILEKNFLGIKMMNAEVTTSVDDDDNNTTTTTTTTNIIANDKASDDDIPLLSMYGISNLPNKSKHALDDDDAYDNGDDDNEGYGDVMNVSGGNGNGHAEPHLGCSVSIIGRDTKQVNEVVNLLLKIKQNNVNFGNIIGIGNCDVRSIDSMNDVVSKTISKLGRIDFVICGAAGNFMADFNHLSANAFKTVIDIDLLGSFNTVKACYNELVKNKGSVIFISATLHYYGVPFQSHVGAAKAGIDALSNALAVELGPIGIRCNCIAPGPIGNTEGYNKLVPNKENFQSKIPLQRVGETKDIANSTVFLFSPAAEWITGAILVVDGGFWQMGNFNTLDMYPHLLKKMLLEKAKL
ncbi:Glucose-6-phosphate 1-dehydrogenase [Pichia californica]|uniref:Glucose-6-phosphate 1-dehydrogenase n=1 Tax=Pichia californica TaxID=460514 RepID=A0A9P6WPA5_9ASCO|nr:Glucose-6-phosphate 1-dehydrogenase [[Candida] californica]